MLRSFSRSWYRPVELELLAVLLADVAVEHPAGLVEHRLGLVQIVGVELFGLRLVGEGRLHQRAGGRNVGAAEDRLVEGVLVDRVGERLAHLGLHLRLAVAIHVEEEDPAGTRLPLLDHDHIGIGAQILELQRVDIVDVLHLVGKEREGAGGAVADDAELDRIERCRRPGWRRTRSPSCSPRSSSG